MDANVAASVGVIPNSSVVIIRDKAKMAKTPISTPSSASFIPSPRASLSTSGERAPSAENVEITGGNPSARKPGGNGAGYGPQIERSAPIDIPHEPST